MQLVWKIPSKHLNYLTSATWICLWCPAVTLCQFCCMYASQCHFMMKVNIFKIVIYSCHCTVYFCRWAFCLSRPVPTVPLRLLPVQELHWLLSWLIIAPKYINCFTVSCCWSLTIIKNDLKLSYIFDFVHCFCWCDGLIFILAP